MCEWCPRRVVGGASAVGNRAAAGAAALRVRTSRQASRAAAVPSAEGRKPAAGAAAWAHWQSRPQRSSSRSSGTRGDGRVDTAGPCLSKGPYWEVGGHGSAGCRTPGLRL